MSLAIAFSSASVTIPSLPTPLRLNKKCRLIGCGIDHSFAVEKNKGDV